MKTRAIRTLTNFALFLAAIVGSTLLLFAALQRWGPEISSIGENFVSLVAAIFFAFVVWQSAWYGFRVIQRRSANRDMTI